VEISGVAHDSRENLLSPSVLEVSKKHGADTLKIKLNSLTFNKGQEFLGLMKALPNVRELEMSEIYITESDSDEDFELKHLTKLEISNSPNLRFCARFVPSSLKILKLSCMWRHTHWDAELLVKQKQLEELSLENSEIQHFKFDPENFHIEKLTIDYLEFLNDSAFEKFSEFIKIQESVTELELAISQEEWTIHNYAEILTHLLSLKSLKKFSFGCAYYERILEVFSSLKICNPAVENLIILDPPYEEADLTPLPKLFPNVTDLKITCPDDDFYKYTFDYFFVDLQPINSMKMIRKLEIEYTTEEMLALLELKELREFHVKEIVSNGDRRVDRLADWKTFINNNCQLEVLHMLPKCRLSVEQLVITLENLPLLKSLEFTVFGCDIDLFSENSKYSSDESWGEYKEEQAEKAAQFIGERYGRLKHLKLDFDDAPVRTLIFNYFEDHYPGVKLYK
jgi:hypothetical protein